jgi:hypothetical protein
MSTVTQVIMEAETISAREYIAREYIAREYMRAATMGEEWLRAAMQAAAQASLAQKTALRQAPGRQEPMQRGSGRQEPPSVHQRQEPSSVSGNRRPDPSLTNYGAAGGQSEVRAVGRARPATKPIRSAKSAIVPEPDQLQSAPPVRPTLPHRT